MNCDFLKDNYLDVRKEAFEKGILDKTNQNTGVYTFQMILCLRNMAEKDVYPDGRFGDEECNLWELFHNYKGKD